MAVLKYRASDGTVKILELASGGVAGVSGVNGKTGEISGVYTTENPPPYPVTSVNGKTGEVTGLYNADNPPPYPVTTINGLTGDVEISGLVKGVTLACLKDSSYGGYFIPSGSNRPNSPSQILSVTFVSSDGTGVPNHKIFEPGSTTEGNGVTIHIWGVGLVSPSEGDPYNMLYEYADAEEVTLFINYVEA